MDRVSFRVWGGVGWGVGGGGVGARCEIEI